MTVRLNNPALWKTGSFINGQWHQSESSFSVENPANQEVIAKVSEVSPSQVEMALNSAAIGQAEWQAKTVDERSDLLRRWYELILKNQHDLAAIMTAEQGKPIKEALGEVSYGAKYIEWYSEQARRVNGELLPTNQQGRRGLVMKRPVGVVSAITPWNFPAAMILRKAAAALAAGCSFVVKPSELTPLSALALAYLSHEAGLPDGVFNVIVGSNAQPIGEMLTTHPKVAKFSFTGSTSVGKKLLQQCANGVKKTAMELGGNAPFIVFEDADMEAAIKGAMGSKFRNAGQTCVCANRFFVHQSRYDEFITRLSAKVAELVMGEGTADGVNIGPLINARAVDKVNQLVTQAVAQGAKVVSGGVSEIQNGYFFQPTILADISSSMDIFKHEIFGPVAAIMPFTNEAEVIDLANRTEYGLCSYVFTENLSRIWRLSEKLAFGMVGINEGVLSNSAAPFGGIKASGMGREGGIWGIEDYLETRYVCIGNLSV